VKYETNICTEYDNVWLLLMHPMHYGKVSTVNDQDIGTKFLPISLDDDEHQRPNSRTKTRQKSYEFSSLLFKVTSTALPLDFYFFKLTQPLTVSTVR
jgi:hypothetical protein